MSRKYLCVLVVLCHGISSNGRYGQLDVVCQKSITLKSSALQLGEKAPLATGDASALGNISACTASSDPKCQGVTKRSGKRTRKISACPLNNSLVLPGRGAMRRRCAEVTAHISDGVGINSTSESTNSTRERFSRGGVAKRILCKLSSLKNSPGVGARQNSPCELRRRFQHQKDKSTGGRRRKVAGTAKRESRSAKCKEETMHLKHKHQASNMAGLARNSSQEHNTSATAYLKLRARVTCSAPEGCAKQPSFGDRFERKARFCMLHREPEHVCLRIRHCEHFEGCRQRALYVELGLHVCGKHLRCLTVLKSGKAALLLTTGKCWHAGCSGLGIYGSLNTTGVGKERFCGKHKRFDDINVRNKRCRAPACLRSPSFGDPSSSVHRKVPAVAIYCKTHSPPGWIDVRNRKCDECHRRATWVNRRDTNSARESTSHAVNRGREEKTEGAAGMGDSKLPVDVVPERTRQGRGRSGEERGAPRSFVLAVFSPKSDHCCSNSFLLSSPGGAQDVGSYGDGDGEREALPQLEEARAQPEDVREGPRRCRLHRLPHQVTSSPQLRR